MARSEKVADRVDSPGELAGRLLISGRERRPNAFNRDMRILEEFAFRHPEGGNAQDFIAAAKATGHPFKSESTIRTIQSVLVHDGLLLKDGRNQFRAPADVVERVRAGERTPVLDKSSRSREWEERRDRIRSELHRIFPPPARFRAVDVFRRLPELHSIQNAYAYLRSFEKRSQIRSFGEGLFGFSDDRATSPAWQPAGPPVAARMVEPAREAEQLSKLFRRFNDFFRRPDRVGQFARPLPEFVEAVFGAVLKPPFPPCLIIAVTDPNPRTPTTPDIELMWFDPETGQARFRAVPSWIVDTWDP